MYTTTYKGYTGKFEIDFDDNLISGIVIDIKDEITFINTSCVTDGKMERVSSMGYIIELEGKNIVTIKENK